jgi:hypothetical protein
LAPHLPRFRRIGAKTVRFQTKKKIYYVEPRSFLAKIDQKLEKSTDFLEISGYFWSKTRVSGGPEGKKRVRDPKIGVRGPKSGSGIRDPGSGGPNRGSRGQNRGPGGQNRVLGGQNRVLRGQNRVFGQILPKN